ncbi:Hint domain-containing protein [Sulfitobacter sp.]|jgi:hypothetical protein|uniref:Hint domain-containing protein n=1 Tax=Sulfitobacter sp. TaxID=1903071 RepID=UPI003EF91432
MADISGTEFDDSIQGTGEDDLIVSGAGNDTIAARGGNDRIEGGTGNDLIFGEDGNDTLIGGDGFDDMFGGEGDDLIEGGTGNDILSGGGGNDTLVGGSGNDIFYDLNPGDFIDGGENENDDYDSINLIGTENGGRYVVTQDPDNLENGIVQYYDADGNDAGVIKFTNIEQIVVNEGKPKVPCFTHGTRIATPRGEVAVEDLRVGDRVITRDNGLQEIRWIGDRAMSSAEFLAHAHLAPIRIAKGALGNDLPERDMMVSPNHRLLVANDKTVLYFEESEVLVAAKHLTGLAGVSSVNTMDKTYVHLMFDKHEVILSDGTWTESFQPGLESLAGVGNTQRNELLEIFPELGTLEGINKCVSARRSIKAHEAAVLIK